VPRSISLSLTTAKLLNFGSDHAATSHLHRIYAERNAGKQQHYNIIRTIRTYMHYNKLWISCGHSQCPLPAILQ